MKKIVLLTTLLLFLVGGSYAQTKNLVTAKIKNLKDKEILVNVYDPTGKERLLDTIILAKNGRFTFNQKFATPVYITFLPQSGLLDTKTIRGVVQRGTMKIELYALEGETYDITGALDGRMLRYTITGSEMNGVLSNLKSKYLEQYMYVDMESEYFRDDRTKEERDSVYNLKDSFVERENVEKVEYIKNNLDKQLSALFLANLAVSTFDQYYEQLAPSVKTGMFKPLLDHKKWVSETLANKRRLSVGGTPIDFTLIGLNNDTITLSSLKGKYVLIYFWASWCHWCIQGAPNLNKFTETHKENVVVVGIASNDNEAALRKVIKEHNVIWNNYMDNTNLSKKYGVTGYPTKVLIGPDGKVLFRYDGESPAFYEEVKSYLK